VPYVLRMTKRTTGRTVPPPWRPHTWYRPMSARPPDEQHRVATPLELFFDLCFVVAVAFAAEELHHAVAENHIGHAVLSYLLVFFAIWWAWMNFTWFASAYDTDDGLYRVTTLVQMAGALMLAAGIRDAFREEDFTLVTFGYIVMRVAMVTQWLRVALTDRDRRTTALRYAVGITVVQVGWVARLALPESAFLVGFVVLALADIAVPLFAERTEPTTWHPHHIAERYGLFTLIVLGESILAASLAFQEAPGTGSPLVVVALSGLVTVFALWWLYFAGPAHDLLTSLRAGLVWGYGHYVVFAAAGAVGGGLAVAMDHAAHNSHLSDVAAGYAVALPVALFLLSVWLLQIRPHQRGLRALTGPAAVVFVLLVPFTPAPVVGVAIVLALAVLVTAVVPGRRSAEP
jgi:low temperature requirement protein LtrA